MADLNISLPKITEVDDKRQQKQIKNYLYQLSEQLRYVLNNLDEDNMTQTYTQKIEMVHTTAEAVEKVIKDLDNNVQANYKDLYNKIVQSATEITNNYEVAIDQQQSRILSSVYEEYTAKGETEQLEQRLLSLIDQTSSDITFRFDQATNYTVEVNDELQSFIDEVRSYQRFSADGLEIGKEGSPFQSRFSNTRLSFLQDGVEIAYVSNNKLYITDVEISHKLTIGNSINGYFDFVPRTNGNLSIVWRES